MIGFVEIEEVPMNAIDTLVVCIVDRMVRRIARIPPSLVPLVRFLAYPFIMWRLRIAARALSTYTRLPPVQWKDVAKHGGNVVYGPNPAFTSERIVHGIWVVDYAHKTYRVVFGIPQEHARVGDTF